MYSVILKKKATKQFDQLSNRDQKRVIIAFRAIGENPFDGKRLQGELDGLWSVRVWPFRIIYKVEKRIVTVTVVAIGDRKNVYKKLKK